MPRRSELAQAMADHVLGDEDRHVATAVVHGDRVPDHLREDHARPRPGLQHLALVALVHVVDAADQARVDERSLLDGTTHRALLTPPVPTANDHLSGGLVAPGAEAHGRLAPRRLRRHAGGRLALATAVRVVAGVHHHAAHLRAAAHVAAASGLADLLVLMVQVAHLADRGH